MLVVENVHWIDASSEEFLKRLTAGARPPRPAGPHDPTRAGPWRGCRPRGDDRPRGPRSPTTCARWCARSSARRAVGGAVELLLAKGEGNPLYVEEILRQLQETGGILVEDGEARLRAADVTVPETIHDIIAARVDRLAESPKQTLQVASVVGRRFGVSLVSRVRETDRNQVAGGPQGLHASTSSSRARRIPS